MKSRKIFFQFVSAFVLLLEFNVVLSQEMVFEREMPLKSAEDRGTVLPIVGPDKMPTLFLLDKSEIWSLALDEDFQQRHEYATPRPKAGFQNLLGYTTEGYAHHLFFTNGNRNQFLVQTIDVAAKESTSKVLGVKLKREVILEAISHAGKFYLLTVKKQTSLLGFYEFEAGELKQHKEYDFSYYRFTKGSSPDLYSALIRNTGSFQTELVVSQIDTNSPIPLEMGATESKLYVLNDKIFITIDNAPGFTKMITLDLNTYEYGFDLIGHGSTTCDDNSRKRSNSFLTSEALYQVMACKAGISFRVKDLETSELMTEYAATQDEQIAFRNGPVRQEGSLVVWTSGKEKEIEETNEFLRKISSSEVGMSVYQVAGKIILMIGGYREEHSPAGGQAWTPGTTISTPYGNAYFPTTYNPLMDSYVTYTTTRAVYFKSVLDSSSYEHLDDELGEMAYDKMKEFEDSISEMSLKTVFRIGDAYLFGYYDKKKGTYALYKFVDD